MRKMICIAMAFCIFSSCLHFAAYGEDTYPDASSIPDEEYRELVLANDINSSDDLDSYIQNGTANVQDGIASYTPTNEDNRILFKRPGINAADAEKMIIRVRIPVEITDLIVYFSVGSGYSEERTFRVKDVQPSDEFQTITIDTSSNDLWNGTITSFGITIRGGIGATFDFDYVYFYGGYRPAYTDDNSSRIYEFDSIDYGFEANENVSDAVVYNSELWARVTGLDSYFTTSEGSFSMRARSIPSIRLSYINDTAGTTGRLYFKTDGDYSEENSFEFAIEQGSGEYVIDTAANANWTGRITGLRLVPSDSEGVVRIGSVVIDKTGRDGDYPDSSLIPDTSYRELVRANELEASDDIDYSQGGTQGGTVTMGGGIASYTPTNDDNRIYFKRPEVAAADVKQIAVKIKVPVAITELTLYFATGTGYSESRTFSVTDIEPSDEFQTVLFNTDSNSLWSGNITAYGITVRGGIGATFDFDGIYFYGDYRPSYTEDERGRLYEFDTPEYGFCVNDNVFDPVVYNSELWMEVTGSDAYLSTNDDFFMSADELPRIRISYDSGRAGTTGKLYFKTNGDYSEENSFIFNTAEGNQEYVIDTADNDGWTGDITGLRFVPTEAESVVRIDYIGLDKFNCSVRTNEGIINGRGNLYGTSGSMTVEVKNAETGDVVHTENVNSAENGDFEFSFELVDVPPAPTEYEIIFSSATFEGSFRKNIIYTSADYAEDMLAQINAARQSGNAEHLKTLIEENYKPLDIQAAIYETVIAQGGHELELYGLLVGGMAESLEMFEEQLNNAALIIYMKYASAEDWIAAVDNYGEYLKFSELPAYATYEASSNKSEIAGSCSSDSFESLDELRDAFQKNVVLVELKHAVAWGNVKSILEANAELIGIDISTAEALKTPSAVYRQLTEKNFSSLEAVKTAFDDAVDDQKREESAPAGGGGGSTGVSSGGGTGGIYMPSPSTATPKPSASPEPSEELFNDLDGFDWARDAVNELYIKGIISGTGDGRFEPARAVTREEFVKMIVAALELPVSAGTDFNDVPSEAWYAGYICAAVNAGIVFGQGETFGVGQPVTRQDAAAMTARALKLDGDADEITYADYDEIADYARNAVTALTQEGILSGDDNGKFRPKEALTRAEAAVIISRFTERI